MNGLPRSLHAALAAALFLGFAAWAAAADITVRNAWMRPVRAGTQANGVYVDITSSVPIRLIGATTSVAKSVVIVLVDQKSDGTSVDNVVKQVEIPGGTETRFAYNGNRLDLLDVTETLSPGVSVPLKLVFLEAPDRQQTVDIDVLVRGVILPPRAEPDAKTN